MSEVIQCKSCGSSNQLPEGRSSMFCAFCGGAIEKKIIYQSQQNKVFPKIITKGKRELPFKETEWYKDKMIKIRASIENRNITNMARKYGLNSTIIKDVEGYRTSEGYNAVIVYESNDAFSQGRRETEFIPLEYDYTEYESTLDLNSMNIKSFRDILQHYDLEDINELTSLNLDNNQISDWDEILEFKMLSKLSLKNNLIENFPNKLPSKVGNKDNIKSSIRELDLTGNKITTINNTIPNFENDKITIIVKDNPIDWNSLPNEVESAHTFKDGEKVIWKHKLSIDEQGKMILKFIKPPENEFTKDILNSDTNEAKGKCFIATATMGSYNHPEVIELRQFRDNWILQQSWGGSFVKWYYHYGEELAKIIEPNSFLKKISYCIVVKPLVIISRIILK